ncbi:hypothetical protein BKA80DRAFT_41320 [Phyllosticta citrichinensis]
MVWSGASRRCRHHRQSRTRDVNVLDGYVIEEGCIPEALAPVLRDAGDVKGGSRSIHAQPPPTLRRRRQSLDRTRKAARSARQETTWARYSRGRGEVYGGLVCLDGSIPVALGKLVIEVERADHQV